MELSRRDLLKLGVLGSAAMYLPVERLARASGAESLLTLPKPFTYAFVRPPEIDLRAAANGGRPMASLELTMRQVAVPVLGPAPAWPRTNLWAYCGPRGEINPTLHVDKGQPIEVTQINALPGRHPEHGYESWTSVHLHGSASLPQYDGYASDVIKPGQRKVYKYPNAQGARTLWYHDHGVHRTAKNVYAGLAAQYHMHDEMENTSGIPLGAFDAPLILTDASFKRDGSLLWDDNSESSVMGDVILTNGVPWPVMSVHKRRYRFRVLNASVSRAYKLSLSSSTAKLWVIATDGGFMPKPVQVSTFRLGPGERYEVIIDFTGCADKAEVVLRNGRLPNTVEYDNTNKVMKFKVGVGRAPDLSTNEIPSSFYTPIAPRPGENYTGPDEVMGLTEGMARQRRTLKFERSGGRWTIDGKTWNDVVRSGYTDVVATPQPNSIEIWDLVNGSGGWFHPVHAHLVDVKILSRNGRAPFAYERGPKDVVYVGENERVRVIAKFGPHVGRYMIHCHNLVHEDHDMMAQFRVGDEPPKYLADGTRNPGYSDPMDAAPAF